MEGTNEIFSQYTHDSERPLLNSLPNAFNSSNGRVVRASASKVVDSGLNPSRAKPMTLKLVFIAFLLDAQRYRHSVDNNPASLLVVPLGKAHNSS